MATFFCELSGKSSLGVGLFRLSEAASGAIYIDDHNIRDIKLSALRSRISILVQDPVLFVGTVRWDIEDPGEVCSIMTLIKEICVVPLFPHKSGSTEALQ